MKPASRSPSAPTILAQSKGAEPAMRTLVVMSFLLCAQSAQASMLGCEGKNADPAYCQNGVRRAVCTLNGSVLWADTRLPATAGEIGFLASDGPVPKPACGAPAAPAAPAPAAKP
jgi:hypothetical protein